jgi:hypothetical protein
MLSASITAPSGSSAPVSSTGTSNAPAASSQSPKTYKDVVTIPVLGLDLVSELALTVPCVSNSTDNTAVNMKPS